MNRLEWEVDQLKKDNAENRSDINLLKLSLNEVIQQVAIITEKLVTAFKRIENIEDSNKWLNRMSIGTLAGGGVSLIGMVVMWLVQR